MRRRRFLQLSGAVLGTAAASPFWPNVLTVRASGPSKQHVSVTLDPSLPVHPMLQYGAVAEPDKKVRVIVQKKTKGADGKKVAADNGGTHLEAFDFVKADHIEIHQKDALKLGRNKDVLYVSPDAPVRKHGNVIDPGHLKTHYQRTIELDKAWNSDKYSATGTGVTVAVLDTGVNASHADFAAGGIVAINANSSGTSAADKHGHGTHVVGIIKGRDSAGNYIGIAPNARVISVKIADDAGAADEADLLRGLQWCYDNRTQYNIGVVNLSVCSGTASSYMNSPICAAVEQLWLNGVVVVVAAGNRGTSSDATWYAPSNDPYVITVGASDDNNSDGTGDDTLNSFSSRGKTQDGISKPDIVAPGRKIYAPLASKTCTLAQEYSSRITSDGLHIRMSGTSMAAPVVAGTVALIRQKFPNLTPNQIKWLLQKTWKNYGSGANATPGGIGMVDPNEALQYVFDGKSAVGSANQGLTPNSGVNQGGGSTVSWGSAYWDSAYWDSAYWDSAYWDSEESID